MSNKIKKILSRSADSLTRQRAASWSDSLVAQYQKKQIDIEQQIRDKVMQINDLLDISAIADKNVDNGLGAGSFDPIAIVEKHIALAQELQLLKESHAVISEYNTKVYEGNVTSFEDLTASLLTNVVDEED